MIKIAFRLHLNISHSSTMSKIISLQECEEIASKSLKIKQSTIKVIKYELSEDENSFGYIGDFARLTISIKRRSDEHESHSENLFYFVKLNPVARNGEIQNSDLSWLSEREAFIYSQILVKFDEPTRWMPKCYLAREDLIVLEDLHLSGFKHIKHRTRPDRRIIECGLRSIAKMHADSISYETKVLYPKNIGDMFGRFSEEFAIGLDKPWFQMGLSALKKLIPSIPTYHKYQEKYSNQLFDELVSPIYNMIKPSAKYRNVLCHQDLWAGNMMFKFTKTNGNDNLAEPLDCVMMDYQFCRYIPPVTDVFMFILFTTRLENRRKYLFKYFKYYYDCLSSELERQGLVVDHILSWTDFQSSYEDLKLFPIIFNTIGTPFAFFPNEIQMQIKNSSLEKFQRIREISRHEYIIEYMKEDEEFNELVLETIEELMETLFA